MRWYDMICCTLRAAFLYFDPSFGNVQKPNQDTWQMIPVYVCCTPHFALWRLNTNVSEPYPRVEYYIMHAANNLIVSNKLYFDHESLL